MAHPRQLDGQGGASALVMGERPGWSPVHRLAALVAAVALAGFLVGEQVAVSASRPVMSSGPGPAAVSSRSAPAATGPGGDTAALRQAEADGIDVGRVIDEVRHQGVPAGRPGTLAVEDDVYRADPELGPEHPVAPSVIHRPSPSAPAAVSFDGTNYLIVYVADGVRAARMDRTGRLLDRTPLAISPRSVRGTGAADVAFDGTNHLVVWTNPMGSPAGGDIWGTRVSPDGDVLDPGGFPIATDPDEQRSPAVEFDGANHLVAWDTSNTCCGPSPLAVIRIDPSGRRVDPAPTLIAEPTDGALLSFGGSGHLATWMQDDGLWAARLGLDGAVLDPGPFRLSATADVEGHAVAFDGESWQVFWSERAGPAGSYDIVGARISPAGALPDPVPTSPVATSTADETAPFATRDGDAVVVTWTDDRAEGDAYAARVGRSGAVLDPAPIAVATGPGAQTAGPSVAGNDQVLATVRGPESGACCFAQAVRLSATGRALDPSPLLVAYESNGQFLPQLAFDGTNYLIAWNDDRDGHVYRDSVYAARVSRSGVSLDPAGILVGPVTDSTLSDVAFDGENFVVAIERLTRPGGGVDRDGFVVLIAADGELVTPEPVPVAVGPDDDVGIELSPDGVNTVVFWNRIGVGLLAARLSRSGALLDPGGVPISSGPDAGYAAAAFDGTNHFVVYPRGADSPFYPGHEIVGRRVTPSLQLLDPAPLPLVAAPDDLSGADVVWGGSNHLIVWQRRVPGGGRSRIEGALVSRDGLVTGPGPFQLSTLEQHFSPKVASVGGWFLVSWTRVRNPLYGELTVLGSRISESGAMPDPEGFVIVEDATGSDVVAGSDGRWTTTYGHPVDPATGAQRAFLRTVAPK